MIEARERSSQAIRLARFWSESADDVRTGKPAVLHQELGEWLSADPRQVLYRLVNVAEEGMADYFDQLFEVGVGCE